MRETVEIRFLVNGNPTPWELELVRFPTQTQQPTAVRRITELRQQLGPSVAISIERRGDIRRRPEPAQKFRYSIYVKEGVMPINDDAQYVNLEKQTLFSRTFVDSERDFVRAEIFKLFPNAQLTEMKA